MFVGAITESTLLPFVLSKGCHLKKEECVSDSMLNLWILSSRPRVKTETGIQIMPLHYLRERCFRAQRDTDFASCAVLRVMVLGLGSGKNHRTSNHCIVGDMHFKMALSYILYRRTEVTCSRRSEWSLFHCSLAPKRRNQDFLSIDYCYCTLQCTTQWLCGFATVALRIRLERMGVLDALWANSSGNREVLCTVPYWRSPEKRSGMKYKQVLLELSTGVEGFIPRRL